MAYSFYPLTVLWSKVYPCLINCNSISSSLSHFISLRPQLFRWFTQFGNIRTQPKDKTKMIMRKLIFHLLDYLIYYTAVKKKFQYINLEVLVSLVYTTLQFLWCKICFQQLCLSHNIKRRETCIPGLEGTSHQITTMGFKFSNSHQFRLKIHY